MTVSPSYLWEPLALPAGASETLGRWGFMVADRGDGTAILYGGTRLDGRGNGDSFRDTWLVDARGESPVFRRIETAGDPGPRYCGCMTYDPARDTVVMVGGRDLGMIMPETWILDIETSTWTMQPVDETPPGVVACAMAYSAGRDAIYLFGGLGGENGVDVYDRTYRFDPDVPSWTELPVDGPSARFSHVMMPVAPGRPMLMFGGAPATFGVEYFSDLWQFDATSESWSPIVASQGAGPRGRREAWMALEPGGTGLLVGMGAAGVQMTDALADLWHFDLATRTWTDVTPEQSPAARGFSLYLPGGPGRVGHLLGGFDNLGPVVDLHRLLPPADDTKW